MGLVETFIRNVNQATGNAYNSRLSSDDGRRQIENYLLALHNAGDSAYSDSFDGVTRSGLGNGLVSELFLTNPQATLSQSQREELLLNTIALGIGNDEESLANMANVLLNAADDSFTEHYRDLQIEGNSPLAGASVTVWSDDCYGMSTSQFIENFPGRFLSEAELRAGF